MSKRKNQWWYKTINVNNKMKSKINKDSMTRGTIKKMAQMREFL